MGSFEVESAGRAFEVLMRMEPALCFAAVALLVTGCSGSRQSRSGGEDAVATAPSAPAAPAGAVPAAAAAPAEERKLRDRAQFAGLLARIVPGKTDKEQVRALLGEPDDIETEFDPGGITAARTVEIWRYGTAGHLTFPTLGSVHLQADGKVQYVFGGKGAPPAGFDERELRRLLRVIDRVPSYNAGSGYDPRPVIIAVNALQPLGKQRALAAITEYLRVSSWLDDPGREGTFLLLRSLFDPPDPPGYLPAMAVGAGSPSPPADAKALPRFPIAIRGDIPFMLVGGYSLGGMAEPPEHHLEWFRTHGVLRAVPLHPSDQPLAIVDQLVGSASRDFARIAGMTDDYARARVMNQALALVDTVYRVKPDGYGLRFAPGADVDARWQAVLAEFASLSVKWDANLEQYTFADGSSLPVPAAPHYRRAIWHLPLPGTEEARLILERRDPERVDVEVRVTVGEGHAIPAAVVRILDPDRSAELTRLELPPLGTPAGSSHASWSASGQGMGIVASRILELPAGHAVRAELVRGKHRDTSPPMEP